jgi:HlyD family secretion protein
MKKWIKRVAIAVAALTAVGLATAWCLQRTNSKVATFETAKVLRGNLLVTIAASGTLEPEEVVDVGAQISGRILSFGKATDGKTVDYGAVVTQDAVMAKIDDSVYVSALASAQAAVDQDVASIRLAEGNLEQAKAKLKAAKLDWERAQKLGPSDALARTTYDNYCCTYETAVANVAVAEAGIDQAKANLAQAQAVLTTAKQNLSYCTITSPVTGTIIDRRVSVGQTVTAGLNTPSLFLIAKDLKRMQVWVSVNEADIARIYPGQPVTFTVDALPGEQFRGEVFRVRPNASMTQNVVTFTVEIFTDNSSGRLRPYLTANARFEVSRRDNVLQVPTSAVGWTPTADQVAPESQQTPEAASTLAAQRQQDVAATTPSGVGKSAPQTPAVVWVVQGRYVRPIYVLTGLSDGTNIEVIGPGLVENLEIVTGSQETGADGETNNPFTFKPPKGFKPPSGGGGPPPV